MAISTPLKMRSVRLGSLTTWKNILIIFIRLKKFSILSSSRVSDRRIPRRTVADDSPFGGTLRASVSMDNISKSQRKTPKQARSKELVDAIFEATARILPKVGSYGVTTKKIAEIAGVSIGSLYQYFPNKEA